MKVRLSASCPDFTTELFSTQYLSQVCYSTNQKAHIPVSFFKKMPVNFLPFDKKLVAAFYINNLSLSPPA